MIGEVFERNYEDLMAGRFRYDAADGDTLICVDSEHGDPAARYVLLHGKKECFYECLRRMDRFAKKYCGKLRAIFSVESHTATIQVTLSSLRFADWEDFDLLTYVASHAASVSLKNENGSDMLFVNVECFAAVSNDSDVKWSII